MAQTPTKHAHDDDPPAKRHDEPAKHTDPVHPHAAPALAGVLLQPEPAPGEPLIGARGVKGEHIEDGERDPDTIAEEQRRRSAEMEAMGVDAYMKAHSTQIPVEDHFPKVVPGVAKVAPPPENHSHKR